MISIDARDCPKCKTVGSFGIFWIDDHSADRRCRLCRYSKREVLPPLQKTIICLDQNALSQMMMLLNPEFPKVRRNRILPIWREVFRELYAGVRDQIICCPLDEIHKRESIVFAYGDAILNVAKKLNGDVEFQSFDELISHELFYSTKHWRAEYSTEGPQFSEIRAFSESPHRWLNWFNIEITGLWQPKDPATLRAAREQMHTRLKPIYNKWRAERLPFNTIFKEELRSFGPAVLKGFNTSMQNAQARPEIAVFGNSCINYMCLIREALKQAGASTEEAAQLSIEYLSSKGPTNVPSAITEALLYAKQSNMLQAGMKAPSPSAQNDIKRLSCVLPHCDAILMERHFAAMLRELGDRLPASHRRCHVFSVRELGEFLEYLRSVRSSTSTEHLLIARRLYGNEFPEFAN